MRARIICLSIVLGLFCFGGWAQTDPTIRIVAEGLYYPAGLALLPDGGVLIAEAGGHGEHSAGISLLRPDGSLGRLISGLPSSFSSQNLISAPAVAVSPEGGAIIVAIAGSQLYSLPIERARILPDGPFSPADLERRQADRGNIFFLHPFDIAFDLGGAPVVTDAAGNGLVIEGDDGLISYAHRFAALDNPQQDGGRLEALPTGLARFDDSYYVTLFSGCPHVANGGELVAVGDSGQQRTIADGLNMPIDVAVGVNGELWLLEHGALASRGDCFNELDEEEANGRLSRINERGMLESVIEDLHFPVSVLPLPDGSLYVTEGYAGRLLHIEFGGAPSQPRRYPPHDKPTAITIEARDLDQALRAVIEAEALKPYPGRELIESESELTRLGRDLFFDPILSGDQNISCASCHHPEFAMTDGRVLPIGAGGHGLGESRAFRKLINMRSDDGRDHVGTIINPFVDVFIPRNSPTIINSALLSEQFWDGRVEVNAEESAVITPEDAINDLDMTDALMAQVLFPITSQHEMAGVSFGNYPPMVIRMELLDRLRNNADYAARFAEVFGTAHISLRQMAEAVAAFERQLIFTAAPWDDYLAGDTGALSGEQKRGSLLFFGALNQAVNCATCHSGDIFTDQGFHNLLAPQLGPGKDNGDSGLDDFGRANVSFDYRDQYRFKTPSLRNVELTPPYFHSGAYMTLEDVIRHHANPWRANIVYEAAEHLPTEFQDQALPYDFERQAHSVAFPMRAGMPIDEAEVADLVAFLRALTDPAARDLGHITPSEVPSGLPLDPLLR